MRIPFRQISILKGNPRRTHGGFGFQPVPWITRGQATAASLAIAALVLAIAAGSATMSLLADDPDRLSGLSPAIVDDAEAAPEPAAAEPSPEPDETMQAAVTETRTTGRQSRPTPGDAAPAAAEGLLAPTPTLAQMAVPPEPSSARPAFQPDPSPTSAIGGQPAESAAGVDVAESDAEIAALEAEQQAENEAIIAQIRAEEGPEMRAENGNPFNSPVLEKARVTQWVNMRARPSDDGEVLMVVPADATIEAASDCNWCEVAYEGRTGFIYKNFIRWDD